MKPIFFCLFIVCYNNAFSQHYPHKRHYKRFKISSNSKETDIYLGLGLTLGINNERNTNGTASVYFPYAFTNGTSTTNHIASFSSSPSPVFMGTLGFQGELIIGIYYGEFGFDFPFLGKAWNTNDVSFYSFNTGSGIRLLLPENNFAIRLGGNLLGNHIVNQLGRIDFNQQTLVIDGNSYNTDVTVHGRYSTTTYNADYAQISVSQTSYGFVPKVGFEYINYNGSIVNTIYRLNVGYDLSFSNENNIIIQKVAPNHASKIAGNFDLNDPYFDYQFNGSNNHSPPSSVNNLFINFQFIIRCFGKL